MSIATIATKRILKFHETAVCCLLTMALAGCLGEGATTRQAPASSTTQPAAPVAPAPVPVRNTAPTIAGSPSTSAKVSQTYTFRPTAIDADGDPLTFTIVNKPAWASFDTNTGQLTGTPSSSYAGIFPDIRISVTDGQSTATLASYSINVTGDQTGSATLSWQPPTSNTDGSALTNLAGYVVRYGTSLDKLATEVRISNPGLTTYVVSELTPATWYFQVSAFNTSGVESAPSATASKTIG
jgi:hypothetical protein